MLRFKRISHSSTECLAALGGAVGPVYIDTETTGVKWNNRIVSVGLLVDDTIFILFVRSDHHSVRPHQITLDQLRIALEPLSLRTDMTAVFHTAPFDLLKLKQDGIHLRCKVEDTFKLLKLVDPDRGWEPDDEEDTGRSNGTACRWDRRYKEQLNYRLKDVVRHLLGLDAPGFPSAMAALDYERHVTYLTSDLLITRELYLHLRPQLSKEESNYYDELVAPITHIVTDMTFTGVKADGDFIRQECDRLTRLMYDISATHRKRFGFSLDVADFTLRQWLFQTLHCRPRWGHKRVKLASGAYAWSLERAELENLLADASIPATQHAIHLLLDYKLAKSLHSRLKGLLDHIRYDGRIHSRFDDKQASGRITSSEPNLQQLAGHIAKGRGKYFRSDEFRHVAVRSRNAIVGSPGHQFVAFDIAQADVRCLAHIVESFESIRRELSRGTARQLSLSGGVAIPAKYVGLLPAGKSEGKAG